MAELMRETFLEMGLQRAVAAGRGRARQRARHPRGLGRRAEPDVQRAHGHLVLGPRAVARRACRASSRRRFVEDGSLYGLGISNMKGALACYVEALRALGRRGRDAARRLHDRGRLRRDREDAVRRCAGRAVPRLRRRLALPREPRRRRRHVHPRRADGGQGRARPLRLALAAHRHAGQLHPHGLLRGQARPQLDPAHARGDGRGAGVDPAPGRTIPRTPTAASRRSSTSGAIAGGFGWRVSRTPHHTDLFLDVRVPPTKPMAVARGQVLDMVRGLRRRFPDYGVEGEVYVTAPGAEIEEDHPLVAAIDASHAEVFGAAPERDVTRWFSDASALTRYGVPTVNYGTSTGPDGHGAGREPDDRRAGADRRGLRARRPAHLRTRRRHHVKLVTFEHADDRRRRRPCRRRRDRAARRADDARVLRARRRRRERPPRAARRGPAAAADRAQEVLPHRRQLPRARGGEQAGRLGARDRALDRLLPERRRADRPGRPGDLPRAPDRGARLRARAGRDPDARPASGSRPRRRPTTSAAT